MSVDDFKALKAIDDARELIARYVDRSGGCEHEAGFCVCEDKRILARLDDALAHFNSAQPAARESETVS